MRYATIVLVVLMLAASSSATLQKPFELITFDYSELALETENSVKIEWTGKIESFITYNAKCRVFMTMTMESGKKHKHQTAPFNLEGLGAIEVSDTFVVPRPQWDRAVSVEVGAEGYSDADGV
jgi:hypothetical protein